MADDAEPGGFLSRWSRRKAQVRQGGLPVEPQPHTPERPATLPAELRAELQAALHADDAPVTAAPGSADPLQAPPPPTLADVAALTHASDYSRFVAPGVDTGVKNAALKTLFSDPHFNVMDGLDTYIDDYGQPDPMPAGMLRQMVQSHALGLFADERPAEATDPADSIDPTDPIDPYSPAQATLDEDVALRLQPHDAAGPASPATGPGPHTGRQC